MNMADARTVDNLGPQAHEQYIKNALLSEREDVKKVSKNPSIATRAEILTTSPTSTALDQLWGIKKSATSPFTPPANFFLTTADIFTHQLVPTLGLVSSMLEKLQSLAASSKTPLSQKEEEESKKILKFLTLMERLNKILSDIKKRKDEYHKG